MTCRAAVLATVFIALCTAFAQGESPEAVAALAISPRPQCERVGNGVVALAGNGGPVKLAGSGTLPEAPAVRLGIDLLSNRLRILGADFAVTEQPSAAVNLRGVSAADMGEMLSEKTDDDPGGKHLAQAYLLEAGDGRVTITACSGLGLYYGLVSLVQAVNSDPERGPVVPAVTIADWPHISHRLAKTSASSNTPEKVAAFAAWLPLMKMNRIGLQYHGSQSKDPEPPFAGSIETLCPRFRREGVLESIVDFCPFRGRSGEAGGGKEGAYEMDQESDRRAYAEFLRWIMAQGAHGIEVDYNDWPGSAGLPSRESPPSHLPPCRHVPMLTGTASRRCLESCSAEQTSSSGRPSPSDWAKIVMWAHGAAATAYLEQGELVSRDTARTLNATFQGRFPVFAIWFQ